MHINSQMLCSAKSFKIFNVYRTMVYYAVAKGHKVGIFKTWPECQIQVSGFKGAIYKKFQSRQDAEKFIAAYAGTDYFLASSRNSAASDSKSLIHTTNAKIARVDFWPSEDNCEETMQVTDDELMCALDEVEGIKRSRKIPKPESNILEPAGLKHIGNHDFLIDDEGFVIAYTDGSCIRNGQKNATAGFGVYFGEGHALNVAKPVDGRVTNNVGEIQAAIYAIKVAIDLDIKKICISTDSQFLIKSITLWVKDWKRNNWRLKGGGPVKNEKDFKELDELLQKDIKVKWNYVKGHKGIEGNEMADKLAREGSAIYKRLHHIK